MINLNLIQVKLDRHDSGIRRKQPSTSIVSHPLRSQPYQPIMTETPHDNFTASTETPVKLFIEPPGLRIFRLVLFSLVILSSLVGNSMVCRAVWKLPYRKPFSYYLVANLAVAELINSLCVTFLVVYEEKHSWIFGQVACTLINPLLVMAIFVVTSSLATIAVHRYRVIAKPEKRRPSGPTMALTITALWLMALALTLPLFITRKLVSHPTESQIMICASHFPGDELFRGPKVNYNKYSIARFSFTFVVPYVIVCVAYGLVAVKLKYFIRDTSSETIDISSSGVCPISSTAARRATDQAPVNRSYFPQLNAARRRDRPSIVGRVENHLLRMIYMIITVFVACYIPYQVVFFWEYFGAFSSWQFSYHKLMRDYVFILKCLPSAIHPLCYGTMNGFFARAFARIVMCKR